jgi:two-component system sensor histidine kinase DesK
MPCRSVSCNGPAGRPGGFSSLCMRRMSLSWWAWHGRVSACCLVRMVPLRSHSFLRAAGCSYGTAWQPAAGSARATGRGRFCCFGSWHTLPCRSSHFAGRCCLQWFVVASPLMLLPPRVAGLAIVGVVIGMLVVRVDVVQEVSDFGVLPTFWDFVYWTTTTLMGGVGLFAAARLVKAVADLREARAELAELAVGRERLRISRDLHDLLGHTLSAVSLKGDLALRLLQRNESSKAAVEIESLSAVARTALRDIRNVAQHEQRVSIATELKGAADLLSAAGIRTRIDVTVTDLAPDVDDLLGWALREGVTNVLRHSAATVCSIIAQRQCGRVRLEIENDGADFVQASDGCRGLRGLAARAGALSGSAVGQPTRDGRFRLAVEVPKLAE